MLLFSSPIDMSKSHGLNFQELSHTFPPLETRNRQNINQVNLAEPSLSDEDIHSCGIDAEYLSHAFHVTVQSDKDSNLPNYAVPAKDSSFALISLVILMHEQMERQERIEEEQARHQKAKEEEWACQQEEKDEQIAHRIVAMMKEQPPRPTKFPHLPPFRNNEDPEWYLSRFEKQMTKQGILSEDYLANLRPEKH